jgi:predicted DNA-binding antitoxin AbrB/MazE fold protein
MLLDSLEFREGEKRLIKITTEKFLDFTRSFELCRRNLR